MWVTLSSRGGGQVYIKAVHEDMGPSQFERCPERLLNLLTPTSNEYAAEWREHARSWHRRRRAAKAAVGKAVTFERPWNYQQPMNVFTVLSETRFRGEDGLLYRAPKDWWMAPHTVSPA